jgi:signal transduction histidine kinase
LIATALAAIGALAIRHPILALSPFLLFYAAVAVSSWFGGTGPGLLSVLIGSILTPILILPPIGSMQIHAPEGAARLVLFVTIGALIACLNGALRRANERCEAEALLARQSESRVQRLSSELMLAEERERRRIATILHDAVAQTLALSKIKVDTLRHQFSTNGVHERLSEIYELIDRSIVHTRTLTAELSPPVLYELGLAPAIQWLGDRVREEHGISFTLTGDRLPKPTSDNMRIVLFHAVRELLVNIVKHARASKCQVSLRCVDSQIELVVSDNGCGFVARPSMDYSSGGFGLFNIRQRLAQLCGSLEIHSQPGVGTTATLRAPLSASERIQS